MKQKYYTAYSRLRFERQFQARVYGRIVHRERVHLYAAMVARGWVTMGDAFKAFETGWIS